MSKTAHNGSTMNVTCALQKRKGASVQVMNQLTISGDMDPPLGTYRTDAPTISWVAMQISISCQGCR